MGEDVGGKPCLGDEPALLAKRKIKPNPWCPQLDIQFDPWCDPDFPKTTTYKDIAKATAIIRKEVPITEIIKSRYPMDTNLYYKMEQFHPTNSVKYRAAVYALQKLDQKQKRAGVITASLGNWGLALAYQGRKLNIPVTVVVPENVTSYKMELYRQVGATPVVHGTTFNEAKYQAFVIASEKGFSYINGSDHPHVIAAYGAIGIEILEAMPRVDAIVVPVGGGGLLAGIAAAVKQLRPETLVYGVESDKSCCFFKAMENENPYRTIASATLSDNLAMPMAGYNAFHTVRSLIDKMILVDEDCIAQAMSHLMEEEKIIVEGAGAISLAPFMVVPNILPELMDKNVVCLITGANIENAMLYRCNERSKGIDGRLIVIKVVMRTCEDDKNLPNKLMGIISNIGVQIRTTTLERGHMENEDIFTDYMTIKCETSGLDQACTLRRVVERLFPGKCEFYDRPYRSIPICPCFPKKYP